MIPVGALIGAALAMRGGVAQGQPQQVGALGLAFIARVGVSVMWAVGLVVLEQAAAPGPLRELTSVIEFAGFVAIWFPMMFLRWLLVPLGLSRTAYVWSFVLRPICTEHEPWVLAPFFAMWALSRQRAPKPARIADYEEVCFRSIVRQQALSLVTAGLGAWLRRDEARAFALLHHVATMSPAQAPRVARDLARWWTVTMLLSRDDVEGALRVASSPGWLRWSAVIRRAIELRNGTRPATRWQRAMLWALWALAPRRAVTRRMVLALTTPPPPAPPDDATQAVESDGPLAPLAAAMREHLACLQTPATSPRFDARVIACARAWDAARSAPSVEAGVARRVLALNASRESVELLDEVWSRAEEDLTAHVVASRMRLTDDVVRGSRTLEAIRGVAMERDFVAIDAAVAAMRDLHTREAALRQVDEWVEWANLHRALCEAERRYGPSVRHALFDCIYFTVTNRACWLERRGMVALANDQWRRQLPLAEAIEHPEGVSLLQRNVRAST